jgi:hypothetical protein
MHQLHVADVTLATPCQSQIATNSNEWMAPEFLIASRLISGATPPPATHEMFGCLQNAKPFFMIASELLDSHLPLPLRHLV